MMKHTSCIFLLLSFSALAQTMSPEEQKRLVEENKMLRQEILNLKTEPSAKDSAKIMETLQKGKKHQEESNQMLEELDKEE
jgi:hypothetical protein